MHSQDTQGPFVLQSHTNIVLQEDKYHKIVKHTFKPTSISPNLVLSFGTKHDIPMYSFYVVAQNP